MLEVIVDDSLIWSQVPTRPLKILGLETDHHKTDNKKKSTADDLEKKLFHKGRHQKHKKGYNRYEK